MTQSKLRSARVMIAIVGVSLLAASAVRANDIPVTVAPWAPPTVEPFDPNVPAQVPPELTAGEDAVAIYSVEIDGEDSDTSGFTFNDTADGGKVLKIKGVKVSGSTTIKQPTDAPDKLKDHEKGHDTLAKAEYENAGKKVKAALEGFVGMSFVGEGDTVEEKQQSAFEKATAEFNRRLGVAEKAIESQMETLNEKYDSLTDHGKGTGDGEQKGPDGKIKPLTDGHGIAEALREKAKAPEAGKTSFVPDLNRSHAAAATTGLTLDEPTGLMTVDPRLLFTAAYDPLDPVLFGAHLDIDPLLAIGRQANGTFLLADSRLRITDTSGNSLMNAFLFELAFMPSSRAEHVSMIQGYLDVPPVYAGGAVPGVSDFLDSMLSATDLGELTMFHIFFNTPMPFDEFGHFTTSRLMGTTYLATAAVPLPSSLLLLLSGLVVLVTALRRRWLTVTAE